MNDNLIPVDLLCTKYEVNVSFFEDLDDMGLVRFVTVKKVPCIPEEKLKDLEVMIRMHHELDINIAGIEAVLNLLRKIEALREELHATKNKLGLYE
jgi:hypothetical protein